MEPYDVAVLGGGPGGYVAALRAAVRGARVCCIEAQALGGTCLNLGCIPSKAMLHASELAWQMRHAAEFGLAAGERTVDGAAFMRRVARVVAENRAGVESLFKARKIDVLRGRGRLLAAGALAVDAADGPRELRARAVILATGTRPARPAFLPWDSGRVMTTDEATTRADLPESALIIGGGVTGCEFATIYAELGIPVTLIELLDRLVPGLDADASKAVQRSLMKRGVAIRVAAKIVAMQAEGNGLTARLESGETLSAAWALATVGRVPNTDGIGLEAVGVAVENGIIRVDERCRTSVPGIYAIGDAAERQWYAHLASRMGIVAADNATGHDHSDARDVVPAGMFTHPEVATVGLAESEARARVCDVRVARYPYLASGMARAFGETDGLVKIIGEAATGRLLGAVVIGPHATDVIQELALAMRQGLTVEQVAATVHAHPTFAEGVLEAAESWLGLPVHTLR